MLGTLQLQVSGDMHWGIRAWPRDAQYPIERGGRLQIILQPLTLWRLGPGRECNASCVPVAGLGCLDERGIVPPCTLKALVDSSVTGGSKARVVVSSLAGRMCRCSGT